MGKDSTSSQPCLHQVTTSVHLASLKSNVAAENVGWNPWRSKTNTAARALCIAQSISEDKFYPSQAYFDHTRCHQVFQELHQVNYDQSRNSVCGYKHRIIKNYEHLATASTNNIKMKAKRQHARTRLDHACSIDRYLKILLKATKVAFETKLEKDRHAIDANTAEMV